MENITINSEFELLENGLEFLDNAIRGYISLKKTECNFIAEDDSFQDFASVRESTTDYKYLKYSILHLSSGVELILKERLKREHWSLLFENIDKADKENLESGDFNSVYFQTALVRLKGISGIKFDEQTIETIKKLRQQRNIIEHFHFKPNEKYLTEVINKTSASIIVFICNNLNPWEFKCAANDLYTSLLSNLTETNYYNYAKELISEKLKDISNKWIIQCNKCFQEYLILDDINLCLFCGSRPTNKELVNEIAMDTTPNEIINCPYCYSTNLYCLNKKFLCLDCKKEL